MKIKKKDAILNAATHLFSVKGFKDTHMAEISKLTGAAEGTIFYHFNNKEELFLTILNEFKESILNEFKKFTEENTFETGLSMTEEMISFYLHMAQSMEDRFLLLHRHDAYELSQTSEPCRQHLEAIYNCMVDMFENAIEQGKKDGSIGDISSRKVAMIIFGMVDGLLRFNTYGLYDAGTLFNELIYACRKILKNDR
ncbi:MAG: TetR/AcrR family transcriptional regulator [Desulfobacterales bacterium]|jgi:AcrR family transcriptional regulator|nr:TetR/AcrR family transcriptional regulator [Desulfobacterales bacterium]